MELKKIKELMDAMEEKKIKKLRIKQDNFELELEKHTHEGARDLHPEELVSYSREKAAVKHDIPLSHRSPINQEIKEHIGTFVTSPMVGTFYSASSPDDPAFVKVGDRVEKDTVVCIVEAMKVMNEVKSGVAGVVSEILVENSHPVEFGTKLFKIS